MVRGIFVLTALACSTTALAGSHSGSSDCTMVTKDTEAKADGQFIAGKFGAWGDSVAVKSGAKAPADGAWCSGCVMVAKGAEAPDAGSFYIDDGAKVSMVKAKDVAGSEGLFCKGGSGKVPWLEPKSETKSTGGTAKATTGNATAATNSSNATAATKASTSGTNFPYSFAMLLCSALTFMMKV